MAVPRSVRTTFVLLLACSAFGAVLLGRSQTLQDLFAKSDGFLITVDDPSRSLEIQPDNEVPVAFLFRNHAVYPVTIVGMETGCGCLVASNVPVTISPGESIERSDVDSIDSR